MIANLSSTIAALMSAALLTSGGAPGHHWQLGQSGYAVARVQTQLGVLGFYPASVNGRVDRALLRAADSYVTRFGVGGSAPLTNQFSHPLAASGTVAKENIGPLTDAVEEDLRILRLYRGSMDRPWSSTIGQAVVTFQRRVGLSPSGSLTTKTLSALAHWTAVAVAARNHWRYVVMPGDSWSLLAWASDLPQSRLAAANGDNLVAGQAIDWALAQPARQSPHPSSPPGNSTPPSTSLPPPAGSKAVVGVLANIRPISDLVLLNPNLQEVQSLCTAESRDKVAVDVAVEGEWALTHLTLVNELAKLGNTVAITSYSGANLKTLPAWGVHQELTWARQALGGLLGAFPQFLLTPSGDGETISAEAGRLHLVPITPAITLSLGSSAGANANTVAEALLRHPNQVVATQGPINWMRLFSHLSARRFVFETLAQIWSER